MMTKFALALLALAPAAALTGGALPYIKVLLPLQQFMNEAEVIAEGVVESVDPQKKTCTVKITKSLKGKCPYTQVRMNLGGTKDAFYAWHPDAALKHYVVGAPAVLFYKTDPYQKASWKGEIYINRFFASLRVKSDVAPEKATWDWEQIEIALNRTFNGPAAELSSLVAGVLSGKQKPPAPDPKVPQIGKEDVLALPLAGAKVEPAKLPPAFRKGAP